MVTMRDVAREAGVSVATVSYVLAQRPDVAISQSTRDMVLEAARRLRYRHNALAADLRRGATRVVGILIYSLGVPMLARKVAAVERGLRDAGYYPFLCHAVDLDAEVSFFKECLSRQVCGLVLTRAPKLECRDHVTRLIEEGCLFVASEPIPDLPIPYVTVDRGGAAATAARHLAALGHRRIGAIVGYTDRAAREFVEGYRRGLADGGAPFDAALVVGIDSGIPYLVAGERAAAQLWRVPAPPTAILTTDDEVAFGVLRALARRGRRVPEDVALVGCDDLPLAAYADVPLTTMAQPAEEVGTRLAQLFVDGLKDPARIAGSRTALPFRWVLRESCGARRAGVERAED